MCTEREREKKGERESLCECWGPNPQDGVPRIYANRLPFKIKDLTVLP